MSRPNYAPRPSRPGCNRRTSWPPSLSLGLDLMSAIRSFIVLLAMLSLSCKPGVSKGATVTLPSGNQIRLLGIGVLRFSQDTPAWWIRYETRISVEDGARLRVEAQEVFDLYRGEVEKSGRDKAALSANEVIPDTFISKNRGHNFIVAKQPDGSWKMRE
jgi:hypothetical protein